MQRKLKGHWGWKTSLPNAQFLPKEWVSQGSRKQVNVCVLLLTSGTSDSLWTNLLPSPLIFLNLGVTGVVLNQGPFFVASDRFYFVPFDSVTSLMGLGSLAKTLGRKEHVLSLAPGAQREVTASQRRQGGEWPLFFGNSLSLSWKNTVRTFWMRNKKGGGKGEGHFRQ